MEDDYREARREFETRLVGIMELMRKDLNDLRIDHAVLKTKVYTYLGIALAGIELAKHFLK